MSAKDLTGRILLVRFKLFYQQNVSGDLQIYLFAGVPPVKAGYFCNLIFSGMQ